jgi:phytanoyl-CoA hydroxylase
VAIRTRPDDLTDETIVSYREHGFVHIPGILAEEEIAPFHDAIQSFSEEIRQANEHKAVRDHEVFTQLVNFWPEHEAIRQLTFHPNIGAVAQKLAGVKLRLWHDHVLIKQPGKSSPTSFHQDQPFWPHDNAGHSLSAWIALCDVPAERGCMSFIPGSQRHTDLPPQSTRDESVLFDTCPELRWEPRVMVPLKAGDCTFHHSRCAHMANPNSTDEPRVAHVIIFTDITTTYSGKGHLVTDPLDLATGDRLEGEMFPPVDEFGKSVLT